MKPGDAIYYAYRVVGFLARLTPLWLGHAIAHLAGTLAAWVRPSERAIVRDNMRHVLGDEVAEDELDRMAYDTYRCMMKNYFDLFWMVHTPLAAIRQRITVEGEENIWAAVREGRGVIIGSLHYGNVEIVLQILPAIGFPCVLPAEHIQPEALFEYFSRLRQSHGLHLIPVDGPLTELLRALRRGEGVGLALDRDTTDSGRLVEFFGKPAKLPDGAAQLALRTGAPVLVALSQRFPRGRYGLRILPPIHFEVTRQPSEEAVEAAMRRILEVVEQELRKDPSQWVVFRRIWTD